MEGGRGGCLEGQWERSDGGARIADVAGSEGRVFLLRGGGWASGAERRGWLDDAKSIFFSGSVLFFFLL